MTNLFDNTRSYVLGDKELNLIGDRDKLAQWRHKGLDRRFTALAAKSSIAAKILTNGRKRGG